MAHRFRPRTDADLVAAELRTVAPWATDGGMARPDLEGALIRPIVALSGWRSISADPPPAEFWYGAMAVQLAHEASLLHDDVIDESARRRGVPTVAALRGIAAALVQGDHVLTTAYRYAARTRSLAFIELFAESVERTVAGEVAQARATGRVLDFDEYSSIVKGKSGALLGCALALAPSIARPDRSGAFYRIGCSVGLVYQMLDDLLDLCPHAVTGKPALADYNQRHWTWPLQQLGIDNFALDAPTLVFALHDDSRFGTSPGQRCLVRYGEEIEAVACEIRLEIGEEPALESLLSEWRHRARFAVALEEKSVRGEGVGV